MESMHAKGIYEDGSNIVETLNIDPIFFSNDKIYIKLLKIGPGENYSSYKVPQNKPWNPSDSDVITTWTALQLDPKTMIINTGDFTFSKSTGQCSHHSNNKFSVPYGSAFGCSGNMDAKARIDLRGTPFAIDDFFASGGWHPVGQTNFSCNNQVVDIAGGGFCGWTVPKLANDSGEENAALGGNFLKVKFLDCLNDSVAISISGHFYIKLKNENYSQYKVPIEKPWDSNDTDVKTIWTQIRFDPTTWLVNTGDFSYTRSTGFCSHHKTRNPEKIPYGSAFGCQGHHCQDASARIDLRGTPFAVDDSFSYGGWKAAGTATFSSNKQVVDIKGGGHCGWMVPTKSNESGEENCHIGGWHLKLKPL